MLKSPHPLDELLGLEYFITDAPGIGGRLRTLPEDFYVEEVYEEGPPDGEVEYTHFTMEKRDWEAHRAIKAIARALRVSPKRFGYAGTKDKRAVTRQRVAVWRVGPEELGRVRIRDITLSDFVPSSRRISLGDASGNRFRIVIRNLQKGREALLEVLETEAGALRGGCPNYFGYQRFGVVRPNTHLVGRELLRGDLEGAVMAYLGRPFPGEREDAYNARKHLDETRDFKAALAIYPSRLDYERSMLEALARNPGDYAGALRRLPKKLRWMLLHAYQGYLFNRILSRLLEAGIDLQGISIPLFGYESAFSEGRQGDLERAVLEEAGVELGRFAISSMPELSSKGGQREALVRVDMGYRFEEDDLNPGMMKGFLEFYLPKGSYATVALREIMKSDPLNY